MACERGVVGDRELVAGPVGQGRQRGIEIVDEGHHVDDRLGRQARDGGRSDVMQLKIRQLRHADGFPRESLRPGHVVIDDLDARVAFAGTGQISRTRGASLSRVATGGHTGMVPALAAEVCCHK